MATIAECPECHGKLRIDTDRENPKVRCPRCSAIFRAGTGELVGLPPEESEPGEKSAPNTEDAATEEELPVLAQEGPASEEPAEEPEPATPSAPARRPPTAEPAEVDVVAHTGRLLLEFATFRLLITGSIVTGVWVAASFAVLVAGFALSGFDWGVPNEAAIHWFAVLAALVALRLFCEGLALLFRIDASLRDVVRDLGQGAEAEGEEASGRKWVDVLTLRSCIFVYLLTAVWLLGTLLIAVVPVPGLGGAPAGALVGVAFLRLGAMFAWRLICEGLAVLFRISETLSDFEREEGFAAEWSFDRFMGLRFMLTPWLVRIIWFVGVPVIVVATLARPFGLAAFVGPTAGVGLCIGGVLGLRLLCELAIVIQRIYESSDGLRNHVRDEYAEGEARADLLPAGPLFFRHMIAPGIIVAAWVLGSLAIIASPVVAVAVGYPARALPVMVPLVLLALLVQRVTAEQSIVVFRIYQSLGEAATMVEEAADQKPQGAGAGFSDFLTFRWMLAPVLIQIDWIVGIVLYVAGIGVAAAAGFGMAEQLKQVLGDDLAGDVSGGGFALLAVLALTMILIQFRVSCEFAIVWFSINKVLTTFRRVLGSLLGVTETEEETRARGAARRTRRLAGAAAAGACIVCALVLVGTGTAVSAAAGGPGGPPARRQPRLWQPAEQPEPPAEEPQVARRPDQQAQPTRPAVQPPQFTWPTQQQQPHPQPRPAPSPEPAPQPTEQAQEPEEPTLTAGEKRQIDIAYRRALYFENRGDNRDACRIYRRLIERYPDVPELDAVRDRYNMHAAREIDQALVLGRGFERNNRPDLARKHYEEVLEVFPDVPGSEEVKARLEQLDGANEADRDEEGG